MRQTAELREHILKMASGMGPNGLSELLGGVRGILQERGIEVGCGRAQDPRPSRMFSVPEGVRYLDGMQLEALTRAVDQWAAQARNQPTRLSRQRIRMIYLMLRYSGAKVGEVLCLDDMRDLDFDACEVMIRGEAPGEPARRVILPSGFMDELRAFLELPTVQTMRGQVFHMDQGFVRRKLAEQAGSVPFPRELLNPTVLRHSRAVELLRLGAPLPVVQQLLGHASAVLTAGYYAFSEGDSRRLLAHYVQKGSTVKTSARNSFLGAVRVVRTGQMLTELLLRTKSGREIAVVITNHSVTNLGIQVGKPVTAIIKAPFVIASHEPAPCFSGPLNCFQGTVTHLQTDGAYWEVRGTLNDGTTMCSLIPYAPQHSTPLELGGVAWFSFRPMSVILLTE